MEVNGVANIKLLVEQLKDHGDMEVMSSHVDEITEKIEEQLNILERYMLAYADHCESKQAGAYGALIVKVEEPLWHEVRENPEQYPNGRERIEGFKKQMRNK